MPEVGNLHHETEGIRFIRRKGKVSRRPEWSCLFAGGCRDAVLGLKDPVDKEFERAVRVRDFETDAGPVMRKENGQGIGSIADGWEGMTVDGKVFPEDGIRDKFGRRGRKAIRREEAIPVEAPFAVKRQ